MKIGHLTRKLSLVTAAAVMLATLSVSSLQAASYKFKVHNNTKTAIKKILVSEDGKTYGFFDIGKGIKAGATEELSGINPLIAASVNSSSKRFSPMTKSLKR